MTDDPQRVPAEPLRRRRHHEVDVEAHAHPGDPRRVVSTDHEECLREPAPSWRRAARAPRGEHR